MLDFTNSIAIERPLKEVFSFIVEMENLPKWNYFVVEVQKTTKGPASIGSRYHQIRKTDQQILEISDLAPNQSVTVETVSEGYPQLDRRMEFSFEKGVTRITDHWKLDTGRPKLLERLATPNIQSAVAENLSKLKILLEQGRVILQDGRHVAL